MASGIQEVLTTTETTRYLRVSRKTLLKLIREGKIPARKIGKNYRYLKSELEKYLKGNEEINYFRG